MADTAAPTTADILCRRGATRHEAVIEDSHVVWYQWGRGDRVALAISGGGGQATHWQDLMWPLLDDVTFVIPDMPGMGRSMLPPGVPFLPVDAQRRLLQQIIAPYMARRPLLIGHSLGGMIAVQLWLTAPEVFSSVVLINPGDIRLDDLAGERDNELHALLRHDPQTILAYFFHQPSEHYQAYADALYQQLSAPTVAAFHDSMPDAERLAIADLRRLPSHSLLFASEADGFVATAVQSAYQTHFPGQVIRMTETAHAAHIERGWQIAATVKAWLPTTPR